MATAAVQPKVVAIRLLIHCLLLRQLSCGVFVIGLCFVGQYLVSFLVLQSACLGRERERERERERVTERENWLLSFYLRNEFNFWNVHGIMNTSGLLQSGLHVNFARDPNYS